MNDDNDISRLRDDATARQAQPSPEAAERETDLSHQRESEVDLSRRSACRDEALRSREAEAERPLWQAMWYGEVIIMTVLLFALGWCLWADWQHDKAVKKEHQIEHSP